VLLPGLDLVNLLDRVQIHRVDGQAIESIRWQRDNVTLAKTGDDVFDAFGLWFVGMDAQNLRGQMVYLGFRTF
jgi:hypothetical protein